MKHSISRQTGLFLLLFGLLFSYHDQAFGGGPFDDDDGDGIINKDDNCPSRYNIDQQNSDTDGYGDACDNCTNVYNPNQADADGDNIGNVCDDTPGTNDLDADGLINSLDNCPIHENPDQEDFDRDNIGDICDTDLVISRIISHNDPVDYFTPQNGNIIPPSYFGNNGEIKVFVTGLHSNIINLITGNPGSLPIDKSPVDFSYSVNGGTPIALATLEPHPVTGLPVLTYTDPYPVVIPQQNSANAESGDSVIQLGLAVYEQSAATGYAQKLVDLSSISLVDGRDIEWEANQAISDKPMTIQVSPAGFDKLEETLLSSQLFPSAGDFSEALTADIPQVQFVQSLSTGEPICLPLNDLPQFKKTATWREVYAEAVALWGAYVAAEETICSDANQALMCAGTAVALGTGIFTAGVTAIAAQPAALQCFACRALEKQCVKEDFPKAKDFEVCFDRLEGQMVSQRVEDMSSVDISIPTSLPNRLNVDLEFDSLNTGVDIQLAGFFIQYKGGAENCTLRPTAEVPEAEILGYPELVDIVTCGNATIHVEKACSSCDPDVPNTGYQSNPEPFSVGISTTDAEKVQVSDIGNPILMLQSPMNELPENTVCTNDTYPIALGEKANELLEQFYPEIQALMNTTWARKWGPKTMADHLTDLVSPVDTGVVDGDYARDQLLLTDLELNSVDGLTLKQSIDVEQGPLTSTSPPAMLYTGTVNGERVYPGGTSSLGAFDVQHTINLAYLNRRIAMQYRDLMNVTLAPTYNELGISPPGGVDPNTLVEMTGTVLGQWNPVFQQFGNAPVIIRASVDVTPFAWMQPDYISQQAPIYVEIPRVTISIVDEKEQLWGKIVAEFKGEVGYPLLGDDNDNNTDNKPIGNWQFGVVDSLALEICDYIDVLQGNACVDGLLADLGSQFELVFDRAFDEMFGKMQVPAYFVQQGDAELPSSAKPLTPEYHLSSDGRYSSFATFDYVLGPDTDLDTVYDLYDNCINVSNVNQKDTDRDGIGDACDLDDDGDGFEDTIDLCPLLPSTQSNVDGDAFGDECDPDSDGDGVLNANDNCALVPNPFQTDSDGDGQGDACDNDKDNDSVIDEADNCPGITNLDQLDYDEDGVGDRCDDDADGDAILNLDDNCPLHYNPDQLDLDLDGIGYSCDEDWDNDTVYNQVDNCPNMWNMDQEDLNGDNVGDACEDPTTADSDFDGVPDSEDAFPFIPVAFRDSDGDELPDEIHPQCNQDCLNSFGLVEDQDDDNDGVLDVADNCPLTYNPNQLDTDGNGIGDDCDDIKNVIKALPFVPLLLFN